MEDIRSLLKQGKTVLVTFIRVDRERRTMICTQNSERIPKNLPGRTNLTNYNPKQIRVFDLVAEQWRSMIDDRIIKFEEYHGKVV